MTALTPRALARWRWMRGQSAIDQLGASWLVVDVDANGRPLLGKDDREAVHPDLNDLVTAASMLLVVREVWGCSLASPQFKGPDMLAQSSLARQWHIGVYDGAEDRNMTFYGYTEVEALAAALDGAP